MEQKGYGFGSMTFEQDILFKIYERTQMIFHWEFSFNNFLNKFFLSQFSQINNTYMR